MLMRFLFADKKPEKRKNICLDLTKNIKAYEMTFFFNNCQKCKTALECCFQNRQFFNLKIIIKFCLVLKGKDLKICISLSKIPTWTNGTLWQTIKKCLLKLIWINFRGIKLFFKKSAFFNSLQLKIYLFLFLLN